MVQQFSLAHLTVIGCTPPEMIHIAARAGYEFVSLRLIPLGLPEECGWRPGNGAMIRQIRAALNDTGVRFLDVELARILPGVDINSYRPTLETAAELGARHVICSVWQTEETERGFIIERYGELCDLAYPLEMTVDLEFPTISGVTQLKSAAEIVRAAERPNGGILLDTLYLHFSKVTLDELGTLPREWIHFMHICDTGETIPATREEMTHIIRDGRLYLGEGCINFAKLLQHLPRVPLSIELPNARRVSELGYEGHARRCLETAKAHLKSLTDPLFA